MASGLEALIQSLPTVQQSIYKNTDKMQTYAITKTGIN